jgi:hypothetical protein
MSRPIIRTTGGPNLRRRRNLTIWAVIGVLVVVGLVVYAVWFRPSVQAPLPVPSASGSPPGAG